MEQNLLDTARCVRYSLRTSRPLLVPDHSVDNDSENDSTHRRIKFTENYLEESDLKSRMNG